MSKSGNRLAALACVAFLLSARAAQATSPADVATARELDGAAVARSRFFVDRREAALNEAGDFLLARAEGAVTDSHIAGELGEVLLGAVEGRRDAGEITAFKSVGLAVEDVAAAQHIYGKARGSSAGRFLEFGGHRGEAD